MKILTPYGPGAHPTLVLEDSKAEDAYEKLKAGEAVEITTEGQKIAFLAGQTWAVQLEDFDGDIEN